MNLLPEYTLWRSLAQAFKVKIADMNTVDIYQDLNEKQREAVMAPPLPLLVLAGAGSGKTRVLVHRIAYLLGEGGISPHSLLAVTFTNKAAAEMRNRLGQLLDFSVSALWVGTFHGLAHRLLRIHWREANLPESFQILDSDDQRRLVKRVIRDLQLDDTRWPAAQSQYFINGQKETGKRPSQINDDGDPSKRQLVQIYSAYEATCQQRGVVDFAELLLRAFELLRDNATLLAHYQERFRHILVDEFQDTNTLQYDWLRLLAGNQGVLTVVGDDDQSIYGWRGGRADHLQRFLRDYPNASVVRLEQNYRSTATILAAANHLIRGNPDRMGKDLWTDLGSGDPIRLYVGYNEIDEANFVIDRIKNHVSEGLARQEMAVLYRSNAQSRVLEEALIASGIPYRVYGGLRFFERAEIKDALAYLRLIRHREDDASFERVVNVPTRGIGARTVDQVRQLAREQGISLWQAAASFVATDSGRAGKAMRVFLELVQGLAREVVERPLDEQVSLMLTRSGLTEFYAKDSSERGESRAENLEELINAVRAFRPESEELSPIDTFLAHAALEAGEAQGTAWEDCVQLMTLHAAKGLEFPIVFLTGLEEGLFPHQRALGGGEGLEEERRLAYVGITRAMRTLYLSYAEKRRLHGSETYGMASRFVGELPGELIEEIRPRIKVSRPLLAARPNVSRPNASTSTKFSGHWLGQRVQHAHFGAGVITAFEGDGPQSRVQVNFERAGSKWLVLSYARLEAASV